MTLLQLLTLQIIEDRISVEAARTIVIAKAAAEREKQQPKKNGSPETWKTTAAGKS
jgi:hypothetical protein